MSSEVTSPARSGRPADVRAALLDGALEELHARGASGVSLRAVARRAGVSHAAPKHHFGDRAGLLTALAAHGHRRLADRLRAVEADHLPADLARRVAALGRAYLDFGLGEPELFELMFRPDQLHVDDPDLVAAGDRSFGVLVDALDGALDRGSGDGPADELALIAWAFVHGLVVLVRDGALRRAARTAAPEEPRRLAFALADAFTALLSRTSRAAAR